jgi:hypothetical protein
MLLASAPRGVKSTRRAVLMRSAPVAGRVAYVRPIQLLPASSSLCHFIRFHPLSPARRPGRASCCNAGL